MEDAQRVDMEEIANKVRAAGIRCQIDQTGGGTATLYAGEVIGGRSAAVAGPGVFSTYRNGLFSDAYAWREELCLGADADDTTDYAYCDEMSDDEIADAIIARVRADVRKASGRTLTAGALAAIFAGMPSDRPVTVGDSAGWWLNISDVTNDPEQPSAIIETTNDFDTRQW